MSNQHYSKDSTEAINKTHQIHNALELDTFLVNGKPAEEVTLYS